VTNLGATENAELDIAKPSKCYMVSSCQVSRCPVPRFQRPHQSNVYVTGI